MVGYEIYAAAIIGILVRIVFMDGYDLKPVYQNGKLQLNVLGTPIMAIVGVIALINVNPEIFATPFGAFVAAFGTPYAVDKVVTKIPLPGDNQEVEIDKVA